MTKSQYSSVHIKHEAASTSACLNVSLLRMRIRIMDMSGGVLMGFKLGRGTPRQPIKDRTAGKYMEATNQTHSL